MSYPSSSDMRYTMVVRLAPSILLDEAGSLLLGGRLLTDSPFRKDALTEIGAWAHYLALNFRRSGLGWTDQEAGHVLLLYCDQRSYRPAVEDGAYLNRSGASALIEAGRDLLQDVLPWLERAGLTKIIDSLQRYIETLDGFVRGCPVESSSVMALRSRACLRFLEGVCYTQARILECSFDQHELSDELFTERCEPIPGICDEAFEFLSARQWRERSHNYYVRARDAYNTFVQGLGHPQIVESLLAVEDVSFAYCDQPFTRPFAREAKRSGAIVHAIIRVLEYPEALRHPLPSGTLVLSASSVSNRRK